MPNHTPSWKSVTWRGLKFANPLGVAGGVDKNGVNVSDWSNLGAGFVEVGTITPLPQLPNPGTVLARDPSQLALWNSMGFPNDGADEIFYNLRVPFQEKKCPIFVNVGKNRATSLEDAHADYTKVIRRFGASPDAYVVNISSPNTLSLRQLQKAEHLGKFLAPVLEEAGKFNKPVLVKLSPDESAEDLRKMLQAGVAAGADGFVLTNTSKQRWKDCPFPETGGVSGQPVREFSLTALRVAGETLGKSSDKLLISSGGVLSADDVLERLKLGAHLVEVYTALIYSGPWFFRQVAKQVQTELLAGREVQEAQKTEADDAVSISKAGVTDGASPIQAST